MASRRVCASKCFLVHAPTKRPDFSQKQSIFSSSTSRSIRPKASEASDSSRSARSGSTSALRPVKLLPILTPPLTAPPLRVLAPKPSSLASSTTASMPCLASSSAVDSPAYPPPMIATRAALGTAARPRAAAAGDHGRSGAHPRALYACALSSAHRRRLPEFRQQRSLPALGARRGQSAEDAAGEARRAAAGADDLVHPVRARHLEPEDPEGAGPLRDARLQDAERGAAKAGRLLARPGAAQGNGAAR